MPGNNSARDFWLPLALSVFILYSTLVDLKTGSTRFFHRKLTRHDDGFMFWVGVLLPLVFALGWLIMTAFTGR